MTKNEELLISEVAEQLNQNRVRTAQRSVLATDADKQNAANRRRYLRGRAISGSVRNQYA